MPRWPGLKAAAVLSPSKSHSHSGAPVMMTPIRCELTGSDQAQAGAVIARGTAPILSLCRLLLASGAKPDAPVECFRNGTLALRVRSVRAGAALTVRETDFDGPRVVRWKAFPHRAVKPPIRQNANGLTRSPPTDDAAPLMNRTWLRNGERLLRIGDRKPFRARTFRRSRTFPALKV
jgi:hypothetical protein